MDLPADRKVHVTFMAARYKEVCGRMTQWLVPQHHCHPPAHIAGRLRFRTVYESIGNPSPPFRSIQNRTNYFRKRKIWAVPL